VFFLRRFLWTSLPTATPRFGGNYDRRMSPESALKTTPKSRPRRYAAPMTAPARPTERLPASPSSLNTRVLGGLLLVFGSGWMLKEAGVLDIPWSAVFSIVLVALGLALLVTARSRVRTIPLVVLGAILTAGLAVGSANIGITGGVGERVLRPVTLTRSPHYRLGIGELQVDLRRAAIGEGDTRITADVGVGHLSVRVPEGLAVRVEVDTNMGNAVVFGDRLDVHGKAGDSTETEGYRDASRRLLLVLHVGVGQIDVTT